MNADWLFQTCLLLDDDTEQAALQRQSLLTKPPEALGELENVAVRLAAMQRRVLPEVNKVSISVFVADHGIAAQAVSAFPQVVTVEMVRNFARGGAAISVMAQHLSASLEVVNLGTATELEPLPGVRSAVIANGTVDFSQQAAMTNEQLMTALSAGRESVDAAVSSGAELFIGGEMGIANTTAATAMACALLDLGAEAMTGPGTGLDVSGVNHKASVIQAALELHQDAMNDPLDVIRCIGGFEIAALVGAYLRCAQVGLPAMVDGFITSVAALVAIRHQPDVAPWLLFSHRSAEPAHSAVLEAIEAKPLLNLGMRLGEGSGAAVALPLLRAACVLHNGMATFAEAEVSCKK